LADIVGVALAAPAAWVLRFDWWFFQYRPEFPVFLLAALLLKPPVFYTFGLYNRYWRYASIHDLKVVVLAGLVATAAMGVFVGIALPARL
ncbi:hypothetical protein OVW19_28660, partial [Klebsiella pneumoniae]|uniref:hypothetical protein n=1 Tax=Klebsiella pneumoniae TaxID=573 RepID=UPI00226F1BF0